jgi:Thioesterase superfamily
MPQHANTLQITFGGQIIQWMETCALVSARRFACTYLMTASIDSLQFIKPTHVGEVVTVRSIVSRTFKSSIEVYVSVEVRIVFFFFYKKKRCCLLARYRAVISPINTILQLPFLLNIRVKICEREKHILPTTPFSLLVRIRRYELSY